MLSPQSDFINTELGKQIVIVFFIFRRLLLWIIASSSLSHILVACYVCPTHQVSLVRVYRRSHNKNFEMEFGTEEK
jgi:hypothetical protein